MQVIHDTSGSVPVTAGELVCFKHPFGNFQGKHLVESSVSAKFQVIRRTELEKSICERLLLQKLFEKFSKVSFWSSCSFMYHIKL